MKQQKRNNHKLVVMLFYRCQENSCYLMDKVVLLRLKFVNCLLDHEKVLDIDH